MTFVPLSRPALSAAAAPDGTMTRPSEAAFEADPGAVRRSVVAPVTPAALSIDQALRRSGPLAQLQQRMGDSNARFDAIRASLPPALAAHLHPGPVDDAGWSLLAANAGIAAKLRQLQPRLEAQLRQRGWAMSTIRIKVLPR